MSLDRMSPEAVTGRLREMSERSDLRAAHRLATKVDMSAPAVTRRLRVQAALRDACLAWGRAGRGPGVGQPGPTPPVANPPDATSRLPGAGDSTSRAGG
jgi:hypothetical protein